MLEYKNNTCLGAVSNFLVGLRAGGDLFAEGCCNCIQLTSENDLNPCSSERRSAVRVFYKYMRNADRKPLFRLPVFYFNKRAAFVVLDVDDALDPRPAVCHADDSDDLLVVTICTDERLWTLGRSGDAVDVEARRNNVRHVLSFVRDSANHIRIAISLNETISLNIINVNIGVSHA